MILNVPVNNFSVMLVLGITSTFWGVNVPCSRTQHGLTRVGLEPRPLDPESEALTTRPPRSPFHKVGLIFTYDLISLNLSLFNANNP